MFTWPSLELTPYERRFVNVYDDGKKPGVLRRAYQVQFNSLADIDTPGLETVNLSGRVQIARRSRIFALQFAGMIGSWRINIRTASGENFTAQPSQTGAVATSNWPVVSSLIAGSMMNQLAAYKDQQTVNVAASNQAWFFGSFQSQPLLIEPNWELAANDLLILEGATIPYVEPDPPTEFADGQKLLAVIVHAWEFPNMGANKGRMAGGPQIVGETRTKKSMLRGR